MKFVPMEIVFQFGSAVYKPHGTPKAKLEALKIKEELENLRNFILAGPYGKILDCYLSKEFKDHSTEEELVKKDAFIALMKSISGKNLIKNNFQNSNNKFEFFFLKNILEN